MTDNFEKKVAVDGPVVNAGELGSSTFSPGQALPAGPLGLGQRWTVARRDLNQARRVRQTCVQGTGCATLSLPGGVFNPYSGVKTSVLAFRKGGATERVMFLHAENDGFKLDANHDQPIDEDDLPGLIEAFRDRQSRWTAWHARDTDADWTEKWWFADADAIRAADFNLSANRHRPQSRAKVEHRDPLEILDELRGIETEILGEIDGLAEAVRGAVGK